jgi:hypothetical protein
MTHLNRRGDVAFRTAFKRRPVQFTLARLLGAIALLSVAMSLFIHAPEDDTGFFILTGLIAVGSAIGQLYGYPIKGGLLVIGFYVIIAIVANVIAALLY